MPTVAEEYDLVGGSKTVAEEYGLVGGNKTIAEEYGLSKDITPAKKKRLPILETAQDVATQTLAGLAQGAIDIPVSIGSVLSKLLGNPPEEIQQAVESFRVRPEPQTKLGETFGNVAEFLGPTGGAGGLLRAGAKQILKRQLPKVAETAGAFAGGEAAIETPRTVTGEIDVEQFIKDVGLAGITGGALGLAGKITNPKVKLLGEWAALTQTAPLVGEQRFSTPEEALYGTILLGAFKGVETGINKLAARQGKSPEQVKDEIKQEAQATGKSPQEILIKKEEGAKVVETQVPLKEEEITEIPPQAREGVKPTTQQVISEEPSKAGEAQPTKPPEAKPEEPLLSGGRPGEFTPEEADLFRQAEIALQSGDRESFEEIMRLFGEKRRVIEGRMKGIAPEGAETLRQLGKEEARQPVSDAEIERMAELQGQEFEVIAQKVRDKIPGYDSATIRLFLNDLRTKTNAAVETRDLSKLRPSFLLASKVTSEAGRGLRQVQLDALGTSKIKDIDAGLDYIEKIRKQDPVFHDQIFKMLGTLKTPEEKFRFIASMKEPTFSSYLWEYYYNSILSGPPTQIINVVGNIQHLLLQTPLRGLRAAAEIPIAAVQGRPREAFFGDILPLWSAIKVGFPRGWAKAKQVWKTGMADDITKLGREVGVNMEAFSKSLSPTLRKIAPILSFPTRTMRAMDIIFRSIAYESKIIELAQKTAWQEIKTGKITEAQFAQRTGELTEKPTPDIISSAGKFADYAVFTDKPDQFTQMIMKARDIIPGARFILPFIATPSRLFIRGLEITPGTALIRGLGSPAFRQRLKTPEVSEIAAKQLAGLLLGYIAWNFTDGSLTGPAPNDKAEREAFYRQGKLPWAVKIGDKWVSYRRFEPLNTPIASVALLWESFKNGELKEKDLAQKASAMVIGLGRNLLDSSYLAGVSDILTILAYGDQASDRLEKVVQRQFFSLIPFSSLWRSSTKAIEAATEGEVLVRKPETFKETLRSQLPFLSKTVPAKRDVFGREVILEGGPIRQFLPFKATTETQDLVEKELEGLNITPGIPPKKIAGKELTSEEYDRYVRLSGQRMRINLFQWISNPIWQLASDEQKRKIVERTVDEARKYARQQLDIQKVLGSAK